ncbi:hypothetical protein BBK36DRAFT_1171635 [Trichoderma citrinoviride]|uniref:Zn(2)-C6 fungal-type domain-containing protein n=1 Tax=Trichoderma citrinoviride TaxID=58853 RepID=A0A2T4B269_9HYPO|nr:hypothetical protein BBK36DRAFT_1171635 [Trichoderma citrinoviride]PTB63400.1 hypothetical protein BBK36DRAFT_1171635 [Trichoderma citrinoviride]
MVAQNRPKACGSCITAKRRCDKVRPFCRRCEDRGLDCRYPALIRRTAKAGPPWFLAPETWTIEQSTPRAPPIPIPVFRTFIQQLQQWLLYANSFFPPSMQDAFSAISMHQSCNSCNQDMIARIVQDRADHLARVQALLIHQILRLFDNSVWQQTHAEEAMPTLLSWCQQMWDSAPLDCITSQTPDSVQDAGQQRCGSSSRLWRLWILSESVRRTWLAVMITISAYRTIKDGWCECAGGIMLTARRSSWLASSPSQWETICRTEAPLFVPCLGNRATLEPCNPNDVDAGLCIQLSHVNLGP